VRDLAKNVLDVAKADKEGKIQVMTSMHVYVIMCMYVCVCLSVCPGQGTPDRRDRAGHPGLTSLFELATHAN
jgi:hypothetical protein